MWIRIIICFHVVFCSKWCGLHWLVLFHVPDPPPETSISQIKENRKKRPDVIVKMSRFCLNSQELFVAGCFLVDVELLGYPLSCFLCDKVRTYHRTQSFLYVFPAVLASALSPLVPSQDDTSCKTSRCCKKFVGWYAKIASFNVRKM